MSLDRIPVYYDPRMLAIPEQSFSPSAEKPRQVVEGWRARQFPIDLHSFQPVTVDDLKRAHDAAYVDAILAGELPNGFGDRSAQVAEPCPGPAARCSPPHVPRSRTARSPASPAPVSITLIGAKTTASACSTA